MRFSKTNFNAGEWQGADQSGDQSAERKVSRKEMVSSSDLNRSPPEKMYRFNIYREDRTGQRAKLVLLNSVKSAQQKVRFVEEEQV